MSADVELWASCSLGLEAVVARELQDLGFSGVRADNGRVRFLGGPSAIARANLWLRAADRVWMGVGGELPAATFEELFEGVRSLPWADLLSQDARFPVEAHTHASQLESVPAIQKIVKKAVVESLKRRHRVEWFQESGPTWSIRASIVRDRARITLDTSGTGLHKRGYRTLNGAAPLRETLAAGLVQLTYWTPQRLLVDPFCGSGTLLLEAAMLGLGRAPGLRRSFAAEGWGWAGGQAWREAREEAEDRLDRSTRLQLLGHDADPDVLRTARHHLRLAGLEGRGIHFQQAGIEALRSQRTHGMILTNPPYGERMLDRGEAERLYRRFGEVVGGLGTWSVYVLSGHPQFERHFGHPSARRRKVYNGMMPCTFHQRLGPPPPDLRRPSSARSSGEERGAGSTSSPRAGV